MRGTLEARLMNLSMPEPNSGCVLWLGYIDPYGYARITVSRQATGKLAHVVNYELMVGPVPDGLELDHLCRVRSCIAEWHMEPVTHQVNILRGRGVAARNAVATACVNGHAFDEVNTYHIPSGAGRSCITCRRAAGRKYEAKKRGAMRAAS